jgi:hypothetical protein
MALGRERIARQGKNHGIRTPYGYVTDADGYFRVSDRPAGDSGMTESEVVRFIFEQAITRRMSSGRLATLLNAKGIPPPSVDRIHSAIAYTGKWTHGIVSAILSRRRYTGTHEMQTKRGEVVTVNVPPIITEEMFEEARATVAENRHVLVGHPSEPLLLSHRLFCGVCGRHMSGYSMKKREGDETVAQYRYYRCNGMRDKLCAVPALSGIRAERAVWDACVEFLADPPAALAAYHRPIADTSTQEHLEAELAGVRQRLGDLATERERVISLYARGLVSSEDTDPELRRIGAEVESLKARQSALYVEIRQSSPAPAPPDFWTMVERNRRVLDRGDVTPEQQQRIIAALVPRIVVNVHREGLVDVQTLTLHAAWGTQTVGLPRRARRKTVREDK